MNINNEHLIKKEDENKSKDISLQRAFLRSFMLFLKVYGVRIIYSLFNLIRKRGLKKLTTLATIFSIFNIANLRTSLCVSLIPFLYNVFKKLLDMYTNKEKNIEIKSF